MRLLLLLLTAALAAPAAEPPTLDKMVDCYKKLGGFQLKEGYWIFPGDRETQYGFYAFNDDLVYFSRFPADPVKQVQTKFTEFPGGHDFSRSQPPASTHSIQWVIPGKRTVWFWMDLNDHDLTQSTFGQASKGQGKAFQEAAPQKVAEGVNDKPFLAAFHNYLVSLLLSHSGRYHHGFSHRQAPPPRKQYFDQLDTCTPAMDDRMQEVIQLEKKLVDLLDQVAKTP